MPAKSKAQAVAMAIAEHNPGALYNRNAGLAKMSKRQLHDYASTPRKGLPMHTPKSPSRAAGVSGPGAARVPIGGVVRATKPHIDKGHTQVANKGGHAMKLRHG